MANCGRIQKILTSESQKDGEPRNQVPEKGFESEEGWHKIFKYLLFYLVFSFDKFSKIIYDNKIIDDNIINIILQGGLWPVIFVR